MLNKHIRAVAAALLMFAASFQAPSAFAKEVQSFATTPDGVKIAIQESGNSEGPELVFVHGLLGSHLTWEKQVTSPLLRKYRIITYDLRGHGLSGRPASAAFYQEGKRWGDELRTVIQAKKLKRPVVVTWSLGGLALTNYLNTYGSSGIGGLVYVDAVFELAPDLVGGLAETRVKLTSSDLAAHLEGTRQFVRACFYKAPDAPTLNRLVAAAAMASLDMTQAVHRGISSPARTTLPKTKVPALIMYGQHDVLTNSKMVNLGRRLLPKAKVISYTESGHAPFYEQAQKFNSDLDKFARKALK
jgi:non-heme chloroperoxidase